ncbi:MAG: class I SAM-dependent methyltransferase [Oligoflexia bacterium]|nr:class I SAM-dependent methyltransferase [Oligoflexia bacterium]
MFAFLKILKDKILESPRIYNAWSCSLNKQRLNAIAKILASKGIEAKNISILDIGCGPGSNSEFFSNCNYLGLDINPTYIHHAQKKYPQLKFKISDVTKLKRENNQGLYNLVIVNSFLHHLSDEQANILLLKITELVNSDGRLIVLEPLSAEKKTYFRYCLMKLDRGHYIREWESYQKLLETHFTIETKAIYPLKIGWITGWMHVIALFQQKN